MAQAKNQYVFGLGPLPNDANDRKTVTEFVVYGVPWQRINYPGTTHYPLQVTRGPTGVSRQRSEIKRTGPASFTQNVVIDVADYQAGQVVGFDQLFIPGGHLDHREGFPVVPYVEGFTLTLPVSATVESVQILDQHYTDVGPYNLPTIRVSPFTEGGIEHTDEMDLDTMYPSDLVVVEVRDGTALFHVSPIQHNPTTNATRFYDQLELAVTYNAPLTVSLTDFATDRDTYTPGLPLVTRGRVHNVGDEAEDVVVHPSITDAFGDKVGAADSQVLRVPAGGIYDLELIWNGTLAGGAYNIHWLVQRGGEPVATAAQGIHVITARITRFTTLDVLVSGQVGAFEFGFANDGPVPIIVEKEIVLYDQATGIEAARLLRKTVTVNPGEEEALQWSWDSATVPPGKYTAAAIARVDDDLFGPEWGSFQIISGQHNRIWVPLVSRNAP